MQRQQRLVIAILVAYTGKSVHECFMGETYSCYIAILQIKNEYMRELILSALFMPVQLIAMTQ